MNKLLKTYEILLKEYGSQMWWPVTEEGKLKPEYTGGPKTTFLRKRLIKKQQLEVIIGALLTQNTSWKNVEKAIINLNKENLIDLEKLKKISQRKLGETIRPSGFYKQKAERLKLIVEFLEQEKEITREKLLEIKGIGPETADSILLYAFQKPEFVVDTYTKRIFSRLGLIKTEKYEEVKSFFHGNLQKEINKEGLHHASEVAIFNEYHALIVEHAKRFCRKEPLCAGCPLNKICEFGKKLIR